MKSHLCWMLFWVPPLAGAAPNEIKVFSDEIAAYGEYNVELHANKASRAGPAAENRATPLQLMPEFSYGAWRNWEISLQLPVAVQQEQLRTNGYRVELQHVAPHAEDKGWYRGVNIEFANLARNGEQRVWNVEIMPIIGLRVERWHIVANPGISHPLSGSARKINFEPAVKLAYRAFGENDFGVEYYLEAGPIQHWLPYDQRSQVLYFAWDGKIGKSDISVALGRGLTGASDRWVLKSIFEF